MCMSSFGEAELQFCVSYNLLTTFACTVRRFTFCLATVGTTFDSYLWRERERKKKRCEGNIDQTRDNCKVY